jgi:hypothetical protein
MAAKTLPIPLPANKAANTNAINISGLYELSNLVIFFSSFHEPEAGRGERDCGVWLYHV